MMEDSKRKENMQDKTTFHNPDSSETFVAWERQDGTHELKFGETDSSLAGHAVLDSGGNPRFLRDENGVITCDDKLPY